MKALLKILLIIGLFMSLSCINVSSAETNRARSSKEHTDTTPTADSVLYKSDKLVVTKLSDQVYMHTSFLNTTSFGRVGCNGMVVVNGYEGVVFDTPADDSASAELIGYLTKHLKTRVKAVIPTHFHEDCVGGLDKFKEYNIPIYISGRTLTMLELNNIVIPKPQITFNDTISIQIGNSNVYAQYFGEGHTRDNIIGYFPAQEAVFGGCLIKELGANKGNLADANVKEWPTTVRKLKQKYSNAKIVIPGHGKPGAADLFDYTIKLFE